MAKKIEMTQFSTVTGNKTLTIKENSKTELMLGLGNTHLIDITVENDAVLKLVEIILPNATTVNINNHIKLGRNAFVQFGLICLNGETITIDNKFSLNGEGAEVKIGTTILGNGSQKFKINTDVVHNSHSTNSKTNIYSALMNKSQVASTANIHITKSGQKTNAFLKDHALLLDKEAKAQATPALEIEANDVKAGHAASATKVSQEELFYCKARGIAEKEAEKIISLGFLQRAFSDVEINAGNLLEEKWQKARK